MTQLIRQMLLAAVFVAMVAGVLPAAVISVVQTDSHFVRDSGSSNKFLENNVSTFSFDAGATADMLIIGFASEMSSAPPGTVSITYNGDALTPAVDQTGSVASIWYLANPYTGGDADIVVDMRSVVDTVNGYGMGIVSVTSGGAPIVLHQTATAASTSSVDITTTVDDTFIVASFNSNNASGSVSANSPLTQIYAENDIGSARGAAGYETDVAAGSHTYSFSVTNEPRSTVAAAFHAVPEPASVVTGTLGLALLAMRRWR